MGRPLLVAALALGVLALAVGSLVELGGEQGGERGEREPPEASGGEPRRLAETTVADPGPGERSEIPPGVVVRPALDSTNEAGYRRLTRAFAPGGAGFLQGDLAGPGVVCGPFLWAAIGGDPALEEDSVRIEVAVLDPGEEARLLVGRAFQHDGVAAFLDVLAEHYPALEGARVTHPLPDDYLAYWRTVPFEVEEPLYVLEADDGTRVLVALDGSARLLWVDDYTATGVRRTPRAK